MQVLMYTYMEVLMYTLVTYQTTSPYDPWTLICQLSFPSLPGLINYNTWHFAVLSKPAQVGGKSLQTHDHLCH